MVNKKSGEVLVIADEREEAAGLGGDDIDSLILKMLWLLLGILLVMGRGGWTQLMLMILLMRLRIFVEGRVLSLWLVEVRWLQALLMLQVLRS